MNVCGVIAPSRTHQFQRAFEERGVEISPAAGKAAFHSRLEGRRIIAAIEVRRVQQHHVVLAVTGWVPFGKGVGQSEIEGKRLGHAASHVQADGGQNQRPAVNVHAEQVVSQNGLGNLSLRSDRWRLRPAIRAGAIEFLAVHRLQKLERRQAEVHRPARRIEDLQFADGRQRRLTPCRLVHQIRHGRCEPAVRMHGQPPSADRVVDQELGDPPVGELLRPPPDQLRRHLRPPCRPKHLQIRLRKILVRRSGGRWIGPRIPIRLRLHPGEQLRRLVRGQKLIRDRKRLAQQDREQLGQFLNRRAASPPAQH